jgi:hypothetical protein
VLAAPRRSGTPYAAVTDQDLARSILGFPEDRYLAWMKPCARSLPRPSASQVLHRLPAFQ